MSDWAIDINTIDRRDAAIENLDDFLASVEQIAYRMAFLALSQHDEALDVVQDSMIKLVRKYSNRPAPEWRTLFFTILHNRITDSHRKNTRKHRLFGWFDRREDGKDPMDTVGGEVEQYPDKALQSGQAMTALEQALQALPLRQQQAFMLRMVEGLSTKETATSMRCSQGSVKTHLSRALATLKAELREHNEFTE